LDGKTPEKVATTIAQAVEDTDVLEDVQELNGFGWATTTELLHVLALETYAILNKGAVVGMEALGYDEVCFAYDSSCEYDFLALMNRHTALGVTCLVVVLRSVNGFVTI